MNKIGISILHSELTRVSGWIEFADKKAGFLGVFYSALVGYLLTNQESILTALCRQDNNVALLTIALTIFIVALVLGIYFLYRTVIPNLKNLNTNTSLFYFGNVANKKILDFLQEIENLTEEQARKEVSEQIHTNSFIADRKMKAVKISTRALFVSFIAFIVVALLI